MRNKIKKRIESEIGRFLKKLNKKPYLNAAPPAIFYHIKKILLQKGKRLRPSLFIISYLGFAKKAARGLYTSALSTELLHNFILIHDDIIDGSEYRRGQASIHNMLAGYLAGYKHAKCTGRDLAIILGDVMYALGIEAFLTIDENAVLKERALKKLIETAVYTGSGEFLELVAANEDIGSATKEDIYKIYDLKTGIYSFAAPLEIGAILGRAKDDDINKLYACGINLGRAFQIRDDISDIVAVGRDFGKWCLDDLREAKRTILVWHAFNNTNKKTASNLKKIMAKDAPARSDLLTARRIILDSGALEYAEKEIVYFVKQAAKLCHASRLDPAGIDQILRLADAHILKS